MKEVKANYATYKCTKRWQNTLMWATGTTMEIMESCKKQMNSLGYDYVTIEIREPEKPTEKIRIYRPKEIKRQLSII